MGSRSSRAHSCRRSKSLTEMVMFACISCPRYFPAMRAVNENKNQTALRWRWSCGYAFYWNDGRWSNRITKRSADYGYLRCCCSAPKDAVWHSDSLYLALARPATRLRVDVCAQALPTRRDAPVLHDKQAVPRKTHCTPLPDRKCGVGHHG